MRECKRGTIALLLCLALGGCDGETPTAVRPSDAARLWRQGEAERPARLDPLLESPPLGARLITPDAEARTGPAETWTIPSRLLRSNGTLRVVPVSGTAQRWYPLELPVPSVLPSLPLLPRRPLADGLYAELVDLLVELTVPFNGTVLRPWRRATLRVALPPRDVGEVDWAWSASAAIDIWNDALGNERLVAVDSGEDAEIVCTVHAENRKAYAIVEAQDHDGSPLSIRIHLSPAWAPGAERWVRRVYVHELGHALGLWGHSDWLGHVMCWRALIADEPHEQEVLVAGMLARLASGFDVSWLDRGDGDAYASPEGEPDSPRRRTVPPDNRTTCNTERGEINGGE